MPFSSGQVTCLTLHTLHILVHIRFYMLWSRLQFTTQIGVHQQFVVVLNHGHAVAFETMLLRIVLIRPMFSTTYMDRRIQCVWYWSCKHALFCLVWMRAEVYTEWYQIRGYILMHLQYISRKVVRVNWFSFGLISWLLLPCIERRSTSFVQMHP